MYGHEPTYGLDRNQQSLGPTSDERIAQMKRDREDIVAALTIAAKQMKDHKDCQVRVPNSRLEIRYGWMPRTCNSFNRAGSCHIDVWDLTRSRECWEN